MGKGDGEPQRGPPSAGDARADRQGRAEHAGQGRRRLTGIARGAAALRRGRQHLRRRRRAGALPARGRRREDLGDWAAAVARYSGADDQATALRFATPGLRRDPHRRGAHHQRRPAGRACAPTRPARVDPPPVRALGLPEPATAARSTARPASACEWLPAPYEQYGDDARRLRQPRPRQPAARPEHRLHRHPRHRGDWDTTLELVNDPTYVVLALHAAVGRRPHRPARRRPDDVGWHAGNWYVNMHSIGLEHEGFAAAGRRPGTPSRCTGARPSWCVTSRTSTASRSTAPTSSATTRCPGTTPANVARHALGPGPVLGLGALLDLLGAPITPRPARRQQRRGDGAARLRRQPAAGDRLRDRRRRPCPAQGTNFVYLHSRPARPRRWSPTSACTRRGCPSTTTSPTSAPAPRPARSWSSQQVRATGRGVVARRAEAWIYNPAGDPVVVPSQGQVVDAGRRPRRCRSTAAPTPRRRRTRTEIPYQRSPRCSTPSSRARPTCWPTPTSQTDYYYAKTFRLLGRPRTARRSRARTRYYQIWFGHRIAYVRAADVTVADGVATPPDGAHGYPAATSVTATAHSSRPAAWARWTCSRSRVAARITVNAG